MIRLRNPTRLVITRIIINNNDRAYFVNIIIQASINRIFTHISLSHIIFLWTIFYTHHKYRLISTTYFLPNNLTPGLNSMMAKAINFRKAAKS